MVPDKLTVCQKLSHPELQFGAITFFAKPHKGESCGSNGLPLTPNSIIIYGRSQRLKTIRHPNLCQYLDTIRGSHERIIVVSQYCGTPLSDFLGKQCFKEIDIVQIVYQILCGLDKLHSEGIVHRYLCTQNVLLQENNDVKLFNGGMYHMTNEGKLVSFPLIQPNYAAPEVYLQKSENAKSHNSSDLWSLGIILVELVLDRVLWINLKLGQKIKKVLSLAQSTSSVFERIAREHNAFNEYQNTPLELKQIINECLNIFPSERPSTKELLQKEIFNDLNNKIIPQKSKVCKPYEIFTLKEFYHWWQLTGGDVFLELKKRGLLRSGPPILSLPRLVPIEGNVLGQDRNFAVLFDPRVTPMPLDTLHERLGNIPISGFYPIIFSKSHIIARSELDAYNVSDLPLVIKERDPEYQFHRIILLRKLLHGYPYTRDLIINQSLVDIPPLLRGDIWAALLNVRGNYEHEYMKIDKDTPTVTDRQIEVDIPRCHQYNELLSSAEGHKKLKRILKAWVSKNSQYVYWQGLDSLTAPFLYLNFNDEAKAFACLSAFIPIYLYKFFLKDNSAIIQEYLAKFSQLIAFHDAPLANHLNDINFIPELFAIPWFLTMFSHVFPLHKILHLWDKLLQGDSSFPLHVGLSVLTQLRSRLLSSGFNECILLFSDLPDVDMERCVNDSLRTYKSTPKSLTVREHQNKEIEHLDFEPSTHFNELCLRIYVKDVVELIRSGCRDIFCIDIRSSIEFNRCALIGSVNIPHTLGNDPNLEALNVHNVHVKANSCKAIVIVGYDDASSMQFAELLLKSNINRVCVLNGGFNVLLPISPTVLTPQGQLSI
ncbi:TBC domain-containing protein kinase-like protein [Onthophagus taurus]|uniref:TBC domain-containing protein kinase-like protein n=1 Tax=Onthophagus taurus TaxID=166361 RepID=UPI0039BEC175